MKTLIALLYCTFFVGLGLWADTPQTNTMPTTWQEQLEAIKNKPLEEVDADVNHLKLVDYVYLGTIGSEAEKTAITDTLLSDGSPAIRTSSSTSIVVKDTLVTENSRTVSERSFPGFEVITMGAMEFDDKENMILATKKQLDELIEIGFEYLRLEWDYKGRKFYSLCVVSSENGGIVYEPITTNFFFALYSSPKEQTINYTE